MAKWSLTIDNIKRTIETIVRRRNGQSVISSQESAIVAESVYEAIASISTERGLDSPPWLSNDTTVTASADTNYTDCDEGVITVVDNTVRIASEGVTLSRIDFSEFYSLDPGEVVTSMPAYYTTTYNGTLLRILWRNTPDKDYTVNLTLITVPDETSIDSIPDWSHGMLRSLSTALALESLGEDSTIFRLQYNDAIKNVREVQRGHSGPVYVKVKRDLPSGYRASELRRSD